MRRIWMVIGALLLTGCSRLYFHESPAGDRFYETAAGEILRVNRTGLVWKESQRVGQAARTTEGGDWDLSAYRVVPPSGHCISAISDDIKPTPCYALVWEVPLHLLSIPFLAVQEGLGSMSVKVKEIPPDSSQSQAFQSRQTETRKP